MAALFQIRRGESTTGSLASGELYYDITSQSLALGSNSGSNIQLAKINGINNGDFELTGDLIVSGNTTIIGNLQFGSTSSIDTVTLLSEVSSSMIPYLDNTFNLGFSGSGDTSKRWNTIYANQISASAFTGSVYGMGDPTSFSTSVDSRLVRAEWTGSNHETRMDLLETAMSGSNRLYVSPEGSDTNDGTEPHKPFKTIKAAVESLGAAVYTNMKRYTIFVGSGNYTEQNPIAVPPGVAIVGDTLRTVRLTAANPTYDFFHVNDSNYFYGLRFLDLKYPAFAFSFPCSSATVEIDGGGISNIFPVYTHPNYTNGETVNVIIEGPDTLSGTIATATANVVNGDLEFTINNAGSLYADGEKVHVSIQAPTINRPVITTSPYIQNCSAITGPFNKSGVKVLQQLPYDIVAFDIDAQGAGGGIRIDGNLVSSLSPLESFVADAFTQVNQGGPGHLVINKGYAQFVSCFTTFCTYGFKVANGGFANISNSVIDFGIKGLISKTYFPLTYNTAIANESKYSSVNGFLITQDGAGYTGSIAGVTLSGPDIIGGTQATAEAVVSALGTITSVYITNSGSGYTAEPLVTIDTPTGAGAVQSEASALISGVRQMKMILSNTTQSVEISSNMILDGENYLVTNVENGSTSDEKLITTYPNPPQIESGSNVYFHKLSNISTGGLVMEYVGSGVTYNALPKFGGVPDRTAEITEYTPGKVFYSTVDNIGNLKIGEFFAVNQLTGEVTIDARNFNLSGINQIGPFRRNGISVGKILREVSDSVTLVNTQGVVGSDTVPTQYAVFGYVNNYTSSTNDRLDTLYTTASNHEGRIDNLELISASYNAYTQSTNTFTASTFQSLDAIHSYTSSLKAAIEVSGSGVGSLTIIYGDLRVEGTQSIINSENLAVKDNLIYLNDSSSITNPDLGIIGNYNDGTYAHTGIYRESANGKWRVFTGLTDEPSGSINSGHPSFQLADFEANEVSASISGIGRVGAYSTSVDSRLVKLEITGSEFDNRLDSIETYTASVSTSVGLLQTFSSSQYKTDSSSFDSRLDLVEATASYLNTTFSTSVDSRLDLVEATASYLNNTFSTSVNSRVSLTEATASYLNNTFSTSVNSRVSLLENFSSSQYNTDSASFTTRISASTLTFNDTNTQTGIDFTQVGTQVSAIASGLTSTSNVKFNNITASNNISSSGTVYCDTLVATTLVGATLPVLQYTTQGTLGNLLIKGDTSKSIHVIDNITFTGITEAVGNASQATGLLMTGSITASTGFSGSSISVGNVITNDITASGNLFVSGTIYAYELHTIIESASVIYSTGSTTFGDQQSDVLNITGSLYQTGSTSFSELTGSLFNFSASLNSRIGTVSVGTLSASIYQTDATQSNNITNLSSSIYTLSGSVTSISSSIFITDSNQTTNITTAQNSANGAFASASAYSASAAVVSITNANSAAGAFASASAYSASAAVVSITNANSAAGAFASASAYSASAATTYAKLGVINTFTQNQIISGSLNVTGDIIAYSTSDERLKDNIKLISNPIEKVNQLRGVEFDWNDKSMFKAGKHDYGVIAQDVEKVLPELVKETHTGYLGVDYDKMIGLLIEVVKEQEKRIKDLENKMGS